MSRDDGWRPIESAPEGIDILLAAYIVPRDEAMRHGARAFWDIAIGAKHANVWCRILGGKPTHWMPLPEPPKGER
jgi:hypothetical protein